MKKETPDNDPDPHICCSTHWWQWWCKITILLIPVSLIGCCFAALMALIAQNNFAAWRIFSFTLVLSLSLYSLLTFKRLAGVLHAIEFPELEFHPLKNSRLCFGSYILLTVGAVLLSSYLYFSERIGEYIPTIVEIYLLLVIFASPAAVAGLIFGQVRYRRILRDYNHPTGTINSDKLRQIRYSQITGNDLCTMLANIPAVGMVAAVFGILKAAREIKYGEKAAWINLLWSGAILLMYVSFFC
ncbi:MAG: hypothetical protein MST10_04185 [Lentisphaeria bacterium]|nr:hypothetical protein [Lentisphaeria bacterium]